MDDDLRAILDRLGARLDRLEARPELSAPGEPDARTFWVLDGIKERFEPAGAVVYAGAVATAAGPVEWQIGQPTEQVLEMDWSALAPNLAALGHPVRLSLLHAIISGAGTVGELAAGEGMGTTGQLYHHLNQLVAQGWLVAGGRGHYSIPPERVVPLMVILTAARRIV